MHKTDIQNLLLRDGTGLFFFFFFLSGGVNVLQRWHLDIVAVMSCSSETKCCT